ncbi:hypothetical protein [Arthrobacter gengyunqii]|uniref:DUF2530 domain-containing protein n=1 Tax=Arthrobacter gengyunqii TaxID=2886940 RepID=A0ABS8GLA0_9MICC|nr:hypothetical protein [Arthrobacter gengyunqii]MCC3267415.1 hypothetical protein [Arthrobacter gengyunqii]
MNTSPASDAGFDAAEEGRRPARTSTIVWGLLLTAAGVLILVWLLTDITFDPLAVLLGLTLGTGAALLVGGGVSALGARKHFTRGGNAHPTTTEQAS